MKKQMKVFSKGLFEKPIMNSRVKTASMTLRHFLSHTTASATLWKSSSVTTIAAPRLPYSANMLLK